MIKSTDRIWKFELRITGEFTIFIPKDFTPMYVGVQRGLPCLWARVDTASPTVEAKVRCYGTGHSLKENTRESDYIGTVIMGGFVWHFYMERFL